MTVRASFQGRVYNLINTSHVYKVWLHGDEGEEKDVSSPFKANPFSSVLAVTWSSSRCL
jgi:hypothetical protein